MSKVSIIMTVSHHFDHVKTSLESILSQTFKRFECIVVGGASLPAQIKSYIRQCGDLRVRFVLGPPGLSQFRLRLFALPLAGGDFISFASSEDIFKPDRLELQLERCSDPTIDLVGSYYLLTDEFLNPRRIIEVPVDPVFLCWTQQFYTSLPCESFLFRRTLLEEKKDKLSTLYRSRELLSQCISPYNTKVVPKILYVKRGYHDSDHDMLVYTENAISLTLTRPVPSGLLGDLSGPDHNLLTLAESFCERYALPSEQREKFLTRLNLDLQFWSDTTSYELFTSCEV